MKPNPRAVLPDLLALGAPLADQPRPRSFAWFGLFYLLTFFIVMPLLLAYANKLVLFLGMLPVLLFFGFIFAVGISMKVDSEPVFQFYENGFTYLENRTQVEPPVVWLWKDVKRIKHWVYGGSIGDPENGLAGSSAGGDILEFARADGTTLHVNINIDRNPRLYSFIEKNTSCMVHMNRRAAGTTQKRPGRRARATRRGANSSRGMA